MNVDKQRVITIGLDPGMLARPFRVQTRWHVITGAACSGKTTMITQLAALGYGTVAETGRQYITRELAKGRGLADIFSAADERAMFEMQRAVEQTLSPDVTLFLDRGLPDSLTFFRLTGQDPNPIVPACRLRRYASVFILDRLPFRPDGVRLDDDAQGDFLDTWLARDYAALGYDVVRVPVMPPAVRLDVVLAYLREGIGVGTGGGRRPRAKLAHGTSRPAALCRHFVATICYNDQMATIASTRKELVR